MQTADEKLAWILILATIPVGLVGLIFEHTFRVLFGKPIRAAIFLIVNGLILYGGERFRPRRSRRPTRTGRPAGRLRRCRRGARRGRRPGLTAAAGPARRPAAAHASGQRAIRRQEEIQALESDDRLSRIGWMEAVIIGSAQILALLAGISRDGVTMVAGHVPRACPARTPPGSRSCWPPR